MLRVTLVLIMLLSSSAGACEIHVRGGPYVDPNMLIGVYREYFDALKKDTNCKVITRLSNDFESFYTSILYDKTDLFITGEQTVATFSKRGFTPQFMTNKNLQGYIVINPASFNLNSQSEFTPDLLKGRSIITPGTYSRGYMFLNKYLKKHNLVKHINIVIRGNHSTSTMDFIKGNIDILVAVNFVYDLLPDKIKSKYYIIAKSKPVSGVMMSSNTTPQNILNAMRSNIDKINRIKWHTYKASNDNVFSKSFEPLILEIVKRHETFNGR